MNAPAGSRIRVLVADDETPARRRLLQFLAEEPDIEVVGECKDGLEACRDIIRLEPDLVFLDVEMPELNGLEVVSQLGPERMPATIFATAYHHYAVPAFDANAMDYLLKPFDKERLNKSLTRMRAWMRRMDRVSESQAQLTAMLAGLGEKKYQSRILVKSGESHELVKAADILYISAEGNYIRLHTAGGSYLMRERMVGVMERMDPAVFRRIHRSHIVNLDHVKKLLPWFGGDHLIMMADGSRLTLSRSYRDTLQDFL